MFKEFSIKSFLNTVFLTALILICCYGVYLRYFVFHFDMGFFLDEINIASNIVNRSYLGLISSLNYEQCAPYFFLIFYKILYNIFGYNEQIFKTTVFICSIINVLLFAYLSCLVLKNKFAILFANILFNLSKPLILYSCIFKHYQSDILCTLLILLIVLKIKDKELNYKQIFLISFLSIFLILFSYTSALIIASSLIFLTVYKYFKENITKDYLKKVLCYITPIIIFSVPYFIINCLPSLNNPFLRQFWEKQYGICFFFVPLSIEDLRQLFCFLAAGEPELCSFNVIILCITASALLMYKRDRFNLCLLTVPFIFAIILGFLRIYPFGAARVSLYLVPVFLLLTVKFFDYTDTSKIKLSGIIFICLLLSFYNFSSLSDFIKLVHNYENDFYNYNGIGKTNIREFSKFLAYSDAKNDDYIVIEMFYSSRNVMHLYNQLSGYQFKDENIIDFDYYERLNMIKKNNKIFFYIPKQKFYYTYNTDLISWIKNNCNIEYDIETYNGNVIKCSKSTQPQ